MRPMDADDKAATPWEGDRKLVRRISERSMALTLTQRYRLCFAPVL